MSLARLQVNSVNRSLDQSGMYNDGNAMSNTSNPPTPKESITQETKATAFHLTEKIPCISPRAQLTKVSYTQALKLLQGPQGTSGPIIRKPTHVKTVEQPMDNPESSTEHTQNQPVTPVSFASTTQDRVDIAVPPPVGQGVPQVTPVWVPLLQITSVTSEANVAASVTSQQPGTSVTTQPQQQSEQCRKCGKKNHSTSCCHKKLTCRKCKGTDHNAKLCSVSTQEELKCTFCGKTKHSMENCKARKKSERKIQKELKARRTSTITSTAMSTMLLRAPINAHGVIHPSCDSIPCSAFTDSSANTSNS